MALLLLLAPLPLLGSPAPSLPWPRPQPHPGVQVCSTVTWPRHPRLEEGWATWAQRASANLQGPQPEGHWPGAGPSPPFPWSPNIPSWDKVSPLPEPAILKRGEGLKPMSLDLLAVPYPHVRGSHLSLQGVGKSLRPTYKRKQYLQGLPGSRSATWAGVPVASPCTSTRDTILLAQIQQSQGIGKVSGQPRRRVPTPYPCPFTTE